VLLTLALAVLVIGAGLGLCYLVMPRGTDTDDGEHIGLLWEGTDPSLATAAMLLALAHLGPDIVGLEDNDAVKVVAGIVGLPVIVLLFIAVGGRLSHD
jgi:hypothetical protein